MRVFVEVPYARASRQSAMETWREAIAFGRDFSDGQFFPHQSCNNVTTPAMAFYCNAFHVLFPTPRSMWRHPDP